MCLATETSTAGPQSSGIDLRNQLVVPTPKERGQAMGRRSSARSAQALDELQQDIEPYDNCDNKNDLVHSLTSMGNFFRKKT